MPLQLDDLAALDAPARREHLVILPACALPWGCVSFCRQPLVRFENVGLHYSAGRDWLGRKRPGIDALKGETKSGDYLTSVHAVMAGGYEQLKKFKEAGAEYEAAATAARFEPDRQRYQSLAARAYLDGGDSAKAKAIWTLLGADSKGTVAGEARVRLGEMAAAAEPRS